MKKVLFILVFLGLSQLVTAQISLYISGYVNDITSGNPVQNHLVIIKSDSANPSTTYPYFSTVYTDATGFYKDTVYLPTGTSQWACLIQTYDCNYTLQTYNGSYGGGTTLIQHDFLICSNSNPSAPTAITGGASGITQTSALINASVNPNSAQTYAEFEFGPTPSYGFNVSAGQLNGTSVVIVAQVLSGLTPATTYHYRIKAQNGYGVAYGSDEVFTTLPADSLPVAITNGVSGITSNGATMYGLYNPNGHSCTIGIEWGLTTSYGSFSSTGGGSGFNYIMDQATIYAFPPNTVVHYRAFLIYSGGTIYGADSTFTTLGASPCHAAFTISNDSANVNDTIHFFDQSTSSSGPIGTYIWAFGDGAVQTITYPQNPNVTHAYLAPGTYVVCLAIQGSDSTCYDQTCDTINVGNPPQCTAAFTSFPDSTTALMTYHFVDQSIGNIVSWLWNFDDPASGMNNTSTLQNVVHSFSAPGTYNVCLTVQGADSSCFDMTCQTIFTGDSTNCQANYSYSLDPASGIYTVNFTNLSTGGPANWLWSFGDGTASGDENPSHAYAAPGSYYACLTMTTNNCTNTYCQHVVIPDTTAYNQIYGQVFAGSFPLSAGMVMIFSLDTSMNYQPYFNVFNIDSNGVYYFTLVPEGNYYILAIPFDSNGYLPTYYGDVLTWQQATLITLGTPSNPYNINLLPAGVMASGPGSASGLINMARLKSTFVDKVNMLLKDDQGEAIGFTRVNEDGSFDFSEMAFGTYYLYPEMPGITSDQIAITLTAEKPHAEVNMTFNGNKITGFSDETDILTGWSVYPNPVDDALTLSIDLKQSSAVQLGIYTLESRQIYQMQVSLNPGRNQVSINPSHLQAGMYLLKVISNDGIRIVTKVIKK